METQSALLADAFWWSWLEAVGPMHGWAIATAAVVSAGCAVVGSLLVVRRLSLLGDAISHAVLPGIVVAVLLGGRPGDLSVLVGATVAALVTVGLTRFFQQQGGLAEDAGTGVAFTTLFAIGVLLVTISGSRIDLDPGCILYGILELVPFDTIPVAGWEVPRAFVSAAAVLVVVSLGLMSTWRWQVFTAFDADAARAAGVPTTAVTVGLLAGVSLATVAGFEAVGAILVVAMLVVPAAAAERLALRLHHVLGLAVLLAMTGAVVGYLAAWHFNTSAAGMMAVVLGLEYVVAILIAPQDGLLAQGMTRLGYAWRVRCEDRLAALWRAEEAGLSSAAAATDGLALRWLRVQGRVRPEAAGYRLTPQGRTEAELIVRSHRLWETWLGRHADLPVDHLHPPAEWIEHHLGARLRRQIEADLGRDARDPHGSAIPPERS
jgi:ABC-type Mn2+/Zn2+ transport system permease subunit